MLSNFSTEFLGIPTSSRLGSSSRNSYQFPKLGKLNQFRLGLCCRVMIEFPELDGIDLGCGTDSAMFNIAIYDVFSSGPKYLQLAPPGFYPEFFGT